MNLFGGEKTVMQSNLVNIVIVQFNTPEKDKTCFQSLIDAEVKTPHMMTFFDNSYKNINLSILWNTLIASSPSEYICLLNNDTRVTYQWLDLMMESMLNDKRVGAVGPSTNNTGNEYQRQLPVNKLPKEVDFAQYSPYSQLDGFCLLLRKEAWRAVGQFNPKYNFFGQESELMFLMQQKGWKTIHRTDAFVYHDHHASAIKANMDLTKELSHAGKLYQETINKFKK